MLAEVFPEDTPAAAQADNSLGRSPREGCPAGSGERAGPRAAELDVRAVRTHIRQPQGAQDPRGDRAPGREATQVQVLRLQLHPGRYAAGGGGGGGVELG